MMACRLVPILCAFLACCHTAAGDWPQWLGPNRSGVVAVEKPIQPWPASGPKIVWCVPCAEGCATPVVSGERLLISRQSGELILGEDGGETFKELARAKVLDGEAFAMPAFADGRLYWRNFREVICLGLRRLKGGDE